MIGQERGLKRTRIALVTRLKFPRNAVSPPKTTAVGSGCGQSIGLLQFGDLSRSPECGRYKVLVASGPLHTPCLVELFWLTWGSVEGPSGRWHQLALDCLSGRHYRNLNPSPAPSRRPW